MFRRVPACYFKKVAVWGCGTMGSGIAQVTAQAAIPVTIVVRSEERIASSRKSIEASVSRVAKKKCDGDAGKMKDYVGNIMQHISWTTDEKAAAGSADLIIETIIETMPAKKELFARLDKLAPKETVFCTNTSSLSVADMATSTNRSERFAGTHFFSPVPMMKLVEIVKTDKVDPKVIDEIHSFSKKIGKAPVIATDTEGFIVNRLLVPYLMEAMRLAERGVASYEDVDTAMMLGCGYPMGPFALSDACGLDVLKLIMDGWHEAYPDNRLFDPVESMNKLVAEGKYGKKTGEGFFKYDAKGLKIPK